MFQPFMEYSIDKLDFSLEAKPTDGRGHSAVTRTRASLPRGRTQGVAGPVVTIPPFVEGVYTDLAVL